MYVTLLLFGWAALPLMVAVFIVIFTRNPGCVLCHYQRIVMGISVAISASMFFACKYHNVWRALVVVGLLPLLVNLGLSSYQTAIERGLVSEKICTRLQSRKSSLMTLEDAKFEILQQQNMWSSCKDSSNIRIFGLTLANIAILYNLPTMFLYALIAMTRGVSRKGKK